MRTRIYARYSTDRQSETSIIDQLRVAREYAVTHGWLVVSEHSDEGISGAALGNRPGCKAALGLLTTGEVLLVMDLFRLARSQDLAPMITRLRHRGIRVIGIQDGFDSEARHARMQAGLSGIMSEEFRAMVSDRTHSALELRARTGQATGGQPYSDPDLLREIFARYAAGESLKVIASDLNRRGIPSPGANWRPRAAPRGKWLVSALHAMLKNERYIGRVVWNRSQWLKDPDTGIRHRRPRPQSEWVVRECEPIVDRQTWDRVQARFRSAAQPRGGVRNYLLSGLLECGTCGSKLVVAGGSQRRYICSAYHHGGEHACPNKMTFPRAQAEEAILAKVASDMLSPEAISIGVRMMAEERRAAEKTPIDDGDLRALERLVREGVLSAEVAAPAIAEAKRKAQPRVPVDLPWPSATAWRAAVEGMRDILGGEDIAAAREALKGLIGPSIPCSLEGDHAVATLAAQQVLLGTGTGGIRIGSGGPLLVHIPISSRRPK